MGGAWYPSLVERFGCVRPFFCHYFAPFGAKMCEDRFDCLVGITRIVLVEFLDKLLLNVVDDALDTDVGDRFLEIKCHLQFFGLHL